MRQDAEEKAYYPDPQDQKQFNAEKRKVHRDFSGEKCRSCESPNIYRQGSGGEPLRAMYRCEDCGARRVLTLGDTDNRYGPRQDIDWDAVERADELWDRMPLGIISHISGIGYGKLSSWSQNDWIETNRTWQGIATKIRMLATRLDNDEIAERLDIDPRAVEFYI